MANKFMLEDFTLTKKGGKTMKYYGSVVNRIMEGQTVPEITVGTDITMYHYSDRTCYYVTDVIDQKHIMVAEYEVIADHDKAGGMGHQNWLFFKSHKETNDYMRAHGFTNLFYDDSEPAKKLWVYRYNKWMEAVTWTPEEILADPFFATEKEKETARKGKPVTRYYNLSGKISFGRRDYYYDWEF